MEALEKFRKTIKVDGYIARHLESLARVVEGTESRTTIFNNLVADLKNLFPGADGDALAQALITEKCRVEYLKMQDEKKPRTYMGRD